MFCKGYTSQKIGSMAVSCEGLLCAASMMLYTIAYVEWAKWVRLLSLGGRIISSVFSTLILLSFPLTTSPFFPLSWYWLNHCFFSEGNSNIFFAQPDSVVSGSHQHLYFVRWTEWPFLPAQDKLFFTSAEPGTFFISSEHINLKLSGKTKC